MQAEERSPRAIGNRVHVVRQHERLAGMEPLVKEDRFRATEEWIVQVDHDRTHAAVPTSEGDERGVTHAQRSAQAVHEVGVVRRGAGIGV